MDARHEYISNNAEKTVLMTMAQSLITDTVSVEIKIISCTDSDQNGFTWDFTAEEFTVTDTVGTPTTITASIGDSVTYKTAFTPILVGEYLVTFYNSTNDVSAPILYTVLASSTTSDLPAIVSSSGLTALEILNRVLQNLGEPKITDFDTRTNDQDYMVDIINEVITDIGIDYKWRPLRVDTEVITLETGIRQYSLPSNFASFDTKSFYYNKEDEPLDFLQYEDIDDVTLTGTPNAVYIEYVSGVPKLCVYNVPTSVENTKTITYRYYAIPSPLTAGTQRSWFPYGYEVSVLVNLVVFKMMHFRGESETSIYNMKVYGDGNRNIGSLAKMRRQYEDKRVFSIGIKGI